MNKKIKILHLEDMPSDAELVARELVKGKINSEILVVTDRTNFVKALNDFSPDIILSDHSLSASSFDSFDSLEALRMVRERGVSVPFILVTATMSDEFAVNVMKEGADDYIVKDRLQQLPVAVINSVKKHRLQKEKQDALERLAFHIQNTQLGFVEWDNKHQVKSWSKRAEEILGWTKKEDIENGKNKYGQLFNTDLPREIKIAEELITGVVERNSIQQKNFTNGEKVRWYEWFNSVLKDKAGKVITIMSLVQDITEQKSMEERLVGSEARLKETQAIAQVGNWEIDLVNNSQVWSDELYKIFRIDKTEVEPSIETFLSFVHPEDLHYVNGKIEKTFKSFQNSPIDFRFISKEGVTRYGYSAWKFEFDKDRHPIRLFGIIQDVTERRQAEMEYKKMFNDLLQRNKELEQFAYIVAHNLRAPMANILSAISILNGPGLSKAKNEILGGGLYASVMRLDNLIEDINHILQVKRTINETKEMVFFSKLVDDIKTSIQNLIDKDNIEIKYDFSGVDEILIPLSYRGYLYSIFYNLISNSIKYRRQEIPCIIEIKSQFVNNKITLVFADNGMGIDLQKKGDQVFGLYKRFHTSIEGKGMGLFMVKTQVETLGGKISIQSEVNKGTEFKVEFEP